MLHTLPNLPFEKDALAPFISKETLEFHHGHHHKTYVDTLNQLIKGTEFENLSLEQIVRRSSGTIFNNAGQAWNHEFYWHSLTPHSQQPREELAEALRADFGSIESFQKKFTAAASSIFGSGWAWLTLNNTGKIEILVTSNADNPLRHGGTPLLTWDVWEHAYYIDYRNERAKYLDSAWRVTNWDFAARNLAEARKKLAA